MTDVGQRSRAQPSVLFHFSEDPNIVRFVPHVPRTNPLQPPAVWGSIASTHRCTGFLAIARESRSTRMTRVSAPRLNRNALVADCRLTSVFDWGCSLYGDFVYELATIVFWSPWYPAIEQLDIATMALDHYGDMGLDVPNFNDRLRCCALHIGLVHLGYNAFIGDLDTLRLTDERMSDFLA